MTPKENLSIGCLILTLLFAISGCGKDSDAVMVDFTKTIAVERPESTIPGFEIPTIISASRLNSGLSAQICGSCHTRGRDKTGKYAYPVDYQTHKGEANLRLYFKEVSYPNDDESIYFWPSGESNYSNQQYLDWKQSEHAKVGVWVAFT